MKGQAGGVKEQTWVKGETHPNSSRFFSNSIWQYNIIAVISQPTRQVVDFSVKEIKYLWRFAYLSLSAANSNTVSASRTTAAWPGWLLFRKSLALETVLDTLLLILKFHLPPIETNQYLINLLVLNFAGISMISQFWQDNISLGFIFTISLGKLIWKRALNFAIQGFSTWYYM